MQIFIDDFKKHTAIAVIFLCVGFAAGMAKAVCGQVYPWVVS